MEGRARELGEVLSLVEEATSAMVEARLEADERARQAIEAVETKVVDALAGEALRGLPDLGDRVFGLRVGVDGSAHAKLPRGRPCMVFDAKGMLVVATLFDGGTAFVQRAPKGTIRASLLVPYLHSVHTALGIHVRSATSRTQEFHRISDLSKRIASSMF